jgi:hypothetical protein
VQHEDREADEASAKASELNAETDGLDSVPDEAPPPEEAQPERVPSRRPVHALGAVGCLTMALAAVAGMALLATGNFFAGVAGILIFAVASGVGLWLSAVASHKNK